MFSILNFHNLMCILYLQHIFSLYYFKCSIATWDLWHIIPHFLYENFRIYLLFHSLSHHIYPMLTLTAMIHNPDLTLTYFLKSKTIHPIVYCTLISNIYLTTLSKLSSSSASFTAVSHYNYCSFASFPSVQSLFLI